MKLFTHTLYFFLLIIQTCFGQWYQQNSGTVNSLYSVSFSDIDNGTAVGDSNTILRTTDGGQNWIAQTSGTKSFLAGVSLTDANNGTVVGYDYDNQLGLS